MNKRRILMASTLVGAILLLLLFALRDDGRLLPRWISWENATLTADSATIVLKQQQVRITTDRDSLLWTTPDTVKVQALSLADADNDGREELILLCWKRGRYGANRPFWVSRDETGWSQHIFLYELSDEAVHPKWGSSYIGQDVQSMAFPLGEDGRRHLLLTAPDGRVSSWLWDSWGFFREKTEVSFVVFGDNLIHEPLYRYGLNHGGDFDFLFENFRDILAKNVAIINQETPLVADPSLYGDYPRFGTPLGVGQAIVDAGFDIVTAATNHALDRGALGVQTTKDFFEKNGVKCLGIQTGTEYEPYTVLTQDQIRFALLNYSYGTNGIPLPADNPYMVHLLKDEEQVKKDIEAARAAADMVLIFPHWGTENSTQIDEFQKKWTGLFLEAGADIVVGTHPHALQPCELLTREDGHQMLVFYSIGNYISAQPEKTSRKGGIASFTVSLTADGYAVTDYALLPLVITAETKGRYSVNLDSRPTPR